MVVKEYKIKLTISPIHVWTCAQEYMENQRSKLMASSKTYLGISHSRMVQAERSFTICRKLKAKKSEGTLDQSK